jgi:hypothetical protein
VSYCSHAVNAGCSFQYLIGEITGHEGFVNFVEIGDTIFHGNLQKIPSPLIWYILEGFGAVPYVTARYSNLSRSQPNATEHPLSNWCSSRD